MNIPCQNNMGTKSHFSNTEKPIVCCDEHGLIQSVEIRLVGVTHKNCMNLVQNCMQQVLLDWKSQFDTVVSPIFTSTNQ